MSDWLDELARANALKVEQRYNDGNAHWPRRCANTPRPDRTRRRCTVTRIIPLTRGYFTFVDDQDYADLALYKWQVCNGYARRSRSTDEELKGNELMHRRIMGNPEGKSIDHVNGNRLDNRRRNLRICESDAQNRFNVPKMRGKFTSQYKGVSWRAQNQKWQVSIAENGKRFVGYFDDEVTAALAYDKAARLHHGAFAGLNFPDIDDYSQVPDHSHESKSGFYGVYWYRSKNKWIATYKADSRNVYVGYFSDPRAAAVARDKAACLHPGFKGKLNFPEDGDE